MNEINPAVKAFVKGAVDYIIFKFSWVWLLSREPGESVAKLSRGLLEEDY